MGYSSQTFTAFQTSLKCILSFEALWEKKIQKQTNSKTKQTNKTPQSHIFCSVCRGDAENAGIKEGSARPCRGQLCPKAHMDQMLPWLVNLPWRPKAKQFWKHT